MADEKKQKAQQQGGQKPKGEGKKAKAEQAEAAAPEQGGKPARPKANNRDTARMRDRYYKEIQPAVMKDLGIVNPMAAPKLIKIVVNMGVGEATQNAKVIDPAAAEIYHQVDPPERGKSSPRTVHVRELAQCTRCQSPCAGLASGRVAPWRSCWDDRKGRGGVIQSAFRLTTARSQLSEIC